MLIEPAARHADESSSANNPGGCRLSLGRDAASSISVAAVVTEQAGPVAAVEAASVSKEDLGQALRCTARPPAPRSGAGSHVGTAAAQPARPAGKRRPPAEPAARCEATSRWCALPGDANAMRCDRLPR